MQELNEQRYQKQKDELQVLESIFGEEDIVHRQIENCWHQPSPLEIAIRLKPSEREAYASIELHVACPPGYPDE